MTAAGVERVVLPSSSAAPSGDLSNAVARYHIMSEQVVRDAGVAWTFLQPNSFMTNTFQWIPQLRTGDLVRAPRSRTWRLPPLIPPDVAAVARRALVSADSRAAAYGCRDPRRCAPPTACTLGTALGRNLQFEAVPDESRART